MTTPQLPALPTLTDAALAFAKSWIADHRQPNGVFHPDAEEIYGKAMMRRWMQACPGYGPDDIFYLAENGNEYADQALRELFAEYTQRGETPPVSVAAYSIRLVRNERKKPGPKKADHTQFVRDVGISLLVLELNRNFGLSFYKNPASHRATASSVAAEALAMTAKNVERIWQRFGPIHTGRFPATYLGPY
jgi:hypothetical protein